MSQQNVATLKAAYEAFANGDIATVLDAMDPEIVWTEAEGFIYADRNPYVGKQAITEGVFQRLNDEFDRYRVEPERFLDAGDTVIVLGRYRSTYRATNVPVNAPFAHLYTFRNGKVVQYEGYTNTAHFQEVTQGMRHTLGATTGARPRA